MAGLCVDCCAGCCADGTYAASTITFYPITQQSLCTHLRLFVVAAGQALEQELLGYILLVGGRTRLAKYDELAEFLELEW